MDTTKMSTIKSFGNRSEVHDPDGKVIFIGSEEGCMKYCDDHDVIDYDETGKPITRTVLRKAFEMVQDEDDWKNPICATFEVISDAAMNRISKAIEFYTGSKAEWSNSENLWLVTAKGYYLSNGENP